MSTHNKLYVFSAPSVTNAGTYTYKVISIAEAKWLISQQGMISAVGHEATAKLLTELLGAYIMENRIFVTMNVGDKAITFRPLQRIPEGTVIRTVDELKKIGYELGLIERIA